MIKPCKRLPIYGSRTRKPGSRPMIGRRRAYVVLWERAHGPVPPGKVLHHTCLNGDWCVEIAHVRPIRQSRHMREHGILGGDWGQRDKSHCPAGHPYSTDNTYRYLTKDGSIERHCKACGQAAKTRFRARRKSR